MSWKPKDKELGLEEAIQQACHDLAPYWFGSPPLMAGILEENQYITVALNPDLTHKNWLIFFMDPTDYSGDLALFYAKEWHKRYHSYRLEILLVLVSPYEFFKDHENIESFVEEHQIRLPLVMDVNHEITKSFGIQTTPQMILLKDGQKQFEFKDESAIVSSEIEIQNFLRMGDPGLPLLPAFVPFKPVFRNHRRLEFGWQTNLLRPHSFNYPGFGPTENGHRVGQLHAVRSRNLAENEIFISGDWVQDAEKISTSDVHAYIAFNCDASALTLVAQPLTRKVDMPKIEVEIDGSSAYEAISANFLSMDELGQSVIRVNRPRTYPALVNLPKSTQEIVLRFPNAGVAPVGIYGIRLGKAVELPKG